MFATTYLLVDPDGRTSLETEVLLPIPPELWGPTRIAEYISLKKPGWHRTTFGYSAYVRIDRLLRRYIFPGLYLRDQNRPSKIIPNFPPMFLRKHFEGYVDSVILQNERNIENANSELNMLVHDLRQLSASIYHSAEEARANIASQSYGEARVKLDSVIATQRLLKVRTDILDFSGNIGAELELERVPVYKRVDKVVRCFSSFASKKGVTLHIGGSSFNEAFGPNVFEIVPYLLIDNAIKYSPQHEIINIDVRDVDRVTTVRVSSVGPFIEIGERQKIFEKDFRSAAAKKTGSTGSGLGLFLAKDLVSRFDGTISVEIGPPLWVESGIEMHQVTFELVLPSAPHGVHIREASLVDMPPQSLERSERIPSSQKRNRRRQRARKPLAALS